MSLSAMREPVEIHLQNGAPQLQQGTWKDSMTINRPARQLHSPRLNSPLLEESLKILLVSQEYQIKESFPVLVSVSFLLCFKYKYKPWDLQFLENIVFRWNECTYTELLSSSCKSFFPKEHLPYLKYLNFKNARQYGWSKNCNEQLLVQKRKLP